MAAPVRLGVIGCGSMARAHLRNAAAHPAVQLQAYADVREAAAQEFLHTFGGRYATTDPARLLRDEGIDALLIATHHDSHAALAIAAAQAGKHVLIEKPLAMAVEDCRRVEEAVERAGIVLVVGFKLRFAPLVQEARRLIERPVLTAGQMVDNRWADTHWAQDPVKGGGNVLSQGCHTFDLVCYLHRGTPVEVYAAGGTFTHDPATTSVIDTVAATLRFADGTAAAIIQSDAGLPAFVSKFFFELFDGRLAVQLTDRLHRMTVSGPALAQPRELRAEEVAPGQDPEGLAQELGEFVHCVQTGAPPVIGATARDGMRATAIALAIFDSVRTGRPQPLPAG
jgi:predicted dehydrogenase